MKILFVTSRIPYPPYRGDKLKIFNMMKILSSSNQIKLLTIVRNRREEKLLGNLRDVKIDVECQRVSLFESMLSLVRSIISRKPFQVAWFESNAFAAKLNSVARSFKPDVVYFHLIRTANYVSSINDPQALIVLDFTDAVSLYLKRFMRTEKRPWRRWLIHMEQKRTELFESEVTGFDVAFICSEPDRNYLLEKGIRIPLELLPNGVDVSEFSFQPEFSDYDPDRIIFTGNMPYFPNREAVLYFAKRIFPEIIRLHPGAKFFIVGGNPPKVVRKLNNGRDIFVTGFVSDIATEYRKSAVAVAPLRFGAGTLNKVIEPLAMGIPVVATSIAVNGLPDPIRRLVTVVDDPLGFAHAVVNILENRPLVVKIDLKDMEKLRLDLSWKNIVGNFEKRLHDLVIAKRGIAQY